MITMWQGYTIKEPEIQKEYLEIKKDPIFHIQKRYKPTFDGVLITIKKVFKITPITLKTSEDEKIQHFRNFAIFILVTYTAEYEKIQSEFHLTQEELQSIKNDESLKEKYKEEIAQYFSYQKDEELINIYSNLCLKDAILQSI